MKVSDFDFTLPPELIAQHPLPERAASRLLVLHKGSGAIDHRQFPDVLRYLNPGDVLVLNDTKVLPARLLGRKRQTGAVIEVVLLKALSPAREWEVLARPGKRLRVGTEVEFGQGEMSAKVLGDTAAGGKIMRFTVEGDFHAALDRLGQMPLPPYIKEQLADKERYQTVYSKNLGSAAAPTAGLHFTQALLEEIKGKGIEIVFLTLHIGLGTFRPVQVEEIAEHKMHSEYYEVGPETAAAINRARERGNRVVVVGTTPLRTLETIADGTGNVPASSGWTDIFIYPGHRFRAVDGLITNFHLPKSTLIMLVAALAGRENVLNAYQAAILERYRFFSFGDAMLII
ncbi:MAG: S-adenosylmethionine:tRNA ribosyltransferase-isomerase [Firmicutes bacterium]|nr:S-adenosylmethionine:tRNA ribosyltransferase-isomerase [candidate division NPL-UPA2 bacterium]MBT9154684.1 S-adenosylmethionine:tRNA ribosyltransferase-isomerase [candidate division NPL-UPA2 bacterium]